MDWESLLTQEVYFIFLALVLAFGILQTTGTAFNTDRPVVSVVSCSMYPTHDIGDIALIYGEDYEDIAEGDVIVFDADSPRVDIPVIHRVVEKNPEYLATQGDNETRQNDFEKRIEPDRIHGKVLVSLPKVGEVKLFAMDLLGYGRTNNLGTGPNNAWSLDYVYSCSNR
mgnify:CR=1 FL=1